jgi:hypothetical protein
MMSMAGAYRSYGFRHGEAVFHIRHRPQIAAAFVDLNSFIAQLKNSAMLPYVIQVFLKRQAIFDALCVALTLKRSIP